MITTTHQTFTTIYSQTEEDDLLEEGESDDENLEDVEELPDEDAGLPGEAGENEGALPEEEI
jgi:hypothetical protein